MAGYLEQARAGVLEWLEGVRCHDVAWGRWRYHAAMDRPWALQASALAITLYHELGALEQVTPAQRASAAAFLLECQDPVDGLFKDPLETEAVRVNYHTWPQIWAQRHGAVLEALPLLGATPRHRLPASQHTDLRHTDARRWVLDLNWQNPWMCGEDWWRAMQAYRRALPAPPTPGDPVLLAMFAALEEEVCDPVTGLPTRRGQAVDPAVAMCGLFKVLFGYQAAGRRYPYAAQAIDSTLALQHPNGEFGRPRNMCMNWDALFVLRELDLHLGGTHRRAELVAAGARCCDTLLREYRRADGGFAFHGDHCLLTHHSIRLCATPQPIGDMLGTVMCIRCLAYVDTWQVTEALPARM